MLKLSRSSVHHIFSNSSFRCGLGFTTSAIDTNISNFTADYFVNSLGFSKQQAIVASSKVSPFKSPDNPNSVLNLLKSTGFNNTQIQKVISSVPKILTYDVNKTLKPKLKAFHDLGLSESDLAHVVSAHPSILIRDLNRHILPTFELLRSVLENEVVMLEALKKRSWLLGATGLSKSLPANVALLKRYGLSMNQINLMFMRKSWNFVLDPKRLQTVLIRLEEELKIPRHSPMFIHGIYVLLGMSEECLESKFKVFMSFGWSEADILRMARRNPRTLAFSESKLRTSLNYFMKDVGLKPAEIASQGWLLTLSLDRRVIPRSEVMKVLKRKRLVKHDYKLSTCLLMTEQRFFEKFLLPFKDKVPDLYSDYMRKVGSGLKTEDC